MLSQVKGGLSVERDLNLGKAKVSWVGSVLVLRSRTRFSKVPITFQARKAVYVYRVCIQDQSFNNFENEFKSCLRARKATGPFDKRVAVPLTAGYKPPTRYRPIYW